MNKSEVTSWESLVRFAELRSKRSVKRNDPIAWSYWRDTLEWAKIRLRIHEMAPQSERTRWPAYAAHHLAEARRLRHVNCREAARQYSRAKWYRIMSLNDGTKDVKPLSLSWLKESAS